MPGIPKPTREICEEYGAFVRTKPCCLYGIIAHVCESPVQAHHVSPRNGTKSAASKVSDRRQVAVCVNAHRYCERYPRTVLPVLEHMIRLLNNEFDAMRRPPKRERKPRRRRPKIVQPCENCNRTHDLPLSATDGEVVHWMCRMKAMRYPQ